MNRHDILLISLGAWLALLAMATVELAAEIRWRLRYRRRVRDASRTTAAATARES
ncbi:hypothetical protein [Streptomyces sp. RPT161]|uniref:hypothetical protein n=1 Tax=Streptomyces sp. RPT161 TaxID=3015993 RepID=UPI0022B91279|nr:hypothetical protein [Streptomyces sp. RPT161]